MQECLQLKTSNFLDSSTVKLGISLSYIISTICNFSQRDFRINLWVQIVKPLQLVEKFGKFHSV